MVRFSAIIPVFNRPDEVRELLESLTRQTFTNFEVVIVEDGSTIPCKEVVSDFEGKLNLKYFFKSNTGPGDTRNFGASKASGNFFVFFDSDCIIPSHYFENVIEFSENFPVECFGGPDKAHKSFTDVQKAINYSMTSLFTTGGIRGGGNYVKKFHPRSFNMGFSKKVFSLTGGFSGMRFGEDIDLSLRIEKEGLKCFLINDAFVYHKRRTDFKKFFKQIYNSGIARINLYLRHPESLKLTHFFPTVFVLFFCSSIILGIWDKIFLLPLASYLLLILIDSTIKNKSLKVGILSIAATLVQMFAYGLGFIEAIWKRLILKQEEFKAFEKNFYK